MNEGEDVDEYEDENDDDAVNDDEEHDCES